MASTAIVSSFKIGNVEHHSLPQEENRVPVVAQETLKNNGDFILTPERTVLYVSIDAVGFPRQACTAAAAAASLAHASAASAASASAGAAVPLGLLITGPLCIFAALVWTLPDACTALEKVNDELRNAQFSASAELKIGTVSAKTKEAIIEAQKAARVGKLGIANNVMFLNMGIAQTNLGVVTMLADPVAKTFHYSAALTGAAGNTAILASGIALGAIYALRGGFMLARAVNSYNVANEFHQNYKSKLTDGVDAAMEFMKEEEARGPVYMDRRVDSSCLINEQGNKLTATSINPGEKIDYLQRVDKGIYTEVLKHKMSIIIAVAMILGGILAIASAVLTAGIVPIIIGLVSAVFFMSMEYLFLTYDSSAIFERLRDRLYVMPPELLKADDRSQLLDSPQPQQIAG